MQGRRAAVYVGGGALLVAWLAAANTIRQPDAPPPVRAAAATDAADDIVVRMREDSDRLSDLLAHAPAPTANSRNPFSFAPVASSRAAAPRRAPAVHDAAAAPLPPPPLPITLMGIAEQASAAGPERTAIVGGPGDEIYMVTVGQTIAARYSVTAIGVDAIELKDLATGGFRRLALQ